MLIDTTSQIAATEQEKKSKVCGILTAKQKKAPDAVLDTPHHDDFQPLVHNQKESAESMVSNSDDSRSGDRESLPLENAIALQNFSDDLAYITKCLQSLQELQELVSTCSGLLVENGMSHKLSMRHICRLLDIYVYDSEVFCDEIRTTVKRLQRTVNQHTGTAM